MNVMDAKHSQHHRTEDRPAHIDETLEWTRVQRHMEKSLFAFEFVAAEKKPRAGAGLVSISMLAISMFPTLRQAVI